MYMWKTAEFTGMKVEETSAFIPQDNLNILGSTRRLVIEKQMNKIASKL